MQLLGVEAFLAHHHAGDVGPPPAWGGVADDGPDAPCAVAGMFGELLHILAGDGAGNSVA